MDQRCVHPEDEEGVEWHRHQADAELVYERVTSREDSREERQCQRAAVHPSDPAAREPGVARVDAEDDEADPGEALPWRALTEEHDRERDDEDRRRSARDGIDEREVAGPVRRGQREDIGRLEKPGHEDHSPREATHVGERVDQEDGGAEEDADDQRARLDLEPTGIGLHEQVPGAVAEGRAEHEQQRGERHSTSLLCLPADVHLRGARIHAMSDHHDHDHAGAPGSPLPETDLRVRALESLLVEKGLVDPAALDALIDTYETKVGPRNGARVVARAWVDPAYKARLLEDASSAIAELGYMGRQGEDMVVLENTPKVHNLVVCTLCSCYPWPVLGLPPVWYKSAPYRSRAVLDPRGVLRECGLELPQDVEVRVWDSTSEVRYLVLPERPEETEGLSEEALAQLVTRDSMIGVATVTPPTRGSRR